MATFDHLWKRNFDDSGGTGCAGTEKDSEKQRSNNKAKSHEQIPHLQKSPFHRTIVGGCGAIY
jgi:hypothetical protein